MDFFEEVENEQNNSIEYICTLLKTIGKEWEDKFPNSFYYIVKARDSAAVALIVADIRYQHSLVEMFNIYLDDLKQLCIESLDNPGTISYLNEENARNVLKNLISEYSLKNRLNNLIQIHKKTEIQSIPIKIMTGIFWSAKDVNSDFAFKIINCINKSKTFAITPEPKSDNEISFNFNNNCRMINVCNLDFKVTKRKENLTIEFPNDYHGVIIER